MFRLPLQTTLDRRCFRASPRDAKLSVAAGGRSGFFDGLPPSGPSGQLGHIVAYHMECRVSNLFSRDSLALPRRRPPSL